MKFPWRCLIAVGGLMLAGALIVGCEEEVIESFPDMTPPATGTGGIRGYMHGDPTEVVLCSDEWHIDELPQGLSMVSCPGLELTATIDSSQNDLFFFDGLEPGDYWLMGKGYRAPNVPRWYVIREGGHRAVVEESRWTNVLSFETEVSTPSARVEQPSTTTLAPSPTGEEATAIAALGKIAFDSNRDGNFEVYLMNADGSGLTRLTDNPAIDGGPVWSPDGARIAFTSNRDGSYKVYVMNADGSGQTRLTNEPGDIPSAWSPDGSRIAFQRARDDNEEVYVMNADGSGQTNLTNNPGLDVGPAWSPDGSRIAFQSGRDGNLDVYVMNADGSEVKRLTDSVFWDLAPAWSPDGTRIAFVSTRDGNWEIYVMNADGSGQSRLTDNPADDRSPTWSPDSSRIAFTSERDGNSEIYLMNADGSDQTRLTDSPADDGSPAWSP